MNNSENKSEQTQTQTIDFYQQLNENPNQIMSNVLLLERTIFQLLKQYPDVFTYNEQQVYDGTSRGANFILENGLLLGKGAYGNVYQTINPNTNLQAALKVQENCDFDQVIQQAEEFKIQKKISMHYPDCIIQIQNKIVISLKYMNTYRMYAYLDLGIGNLKEYLIKFQKFTDQQFNNMFDCILDSIIKIHQLKIAHGDIKLENIINTLQNGWVLADFGCAIQYTTPYGEYPIVGTRVYMQQQVRGALRNNLKVFKMNLFKKDIYAFQLTMLQILYPEENILNLQQILDKQQMIHPKIDQLYNKDLVSIKVQFQQKKFIRTSLIQDSIHSLDDIKMKLENNFKLSFYYKVYQDSLRLPYNKDMTYWTQTLLNVAIQDYPDDQERIRLVMILDSFVDKYSQRIQPQEIFEEIQFEDLTKFEYDLYYDVFEKRGQKMLQLMLCQGYQAILEEQNCNLKFQEAELLYIIGQWEQAKVAINSIQNALELENDEMLLKFICLKARLNNQWINTREQIIPYLINYKDMFQILIEWKFILIDSIWLNKSKNILNTIYLRQHNQFLQGLISLGNLKEQNQQNPIKLNLQQYQKTFYLDSEPLINDKNTNIIKLMQQFNYDKYAIFYQGWIYCEILQYHNIYQLFIEEFIEFIEQNLEGYYFNWAIYDFYAQFLIHNKEFSKAKNNLQIAMKIIQNDCKYHQFILQHHLIQLQIQENNLECVDTFTNIINLIKQIPNSKFVDYLFASLLEELVYICKLRTQLNLRDFLNQAVQIIKSQLNGFTFISLLNYMSQKEEAIINNDFFALKSAMQELPELLELTGDEHEEEVLIDFHELFVLLEQMNLELKDEIRYTSRWIQSLIIFNQLGFNIKKFPKQIVDVTPCLYARSCHRQGDERKLEEAKELYMFLLQNKSWFY